MVRCRNLFCRTCPLQEKSCPLQALPLSFGRCRNFVLCRKFLATVWNLYPLQENYVLCRNFYKLPKKLVLCRNKLKELISKCFKSWGISTATAFGSEMLKVKKILMISIKKQLRHPNIAGYSDFTWNKISQVSRLNIFQLEMLKVEKSTKVDFNWRINISATTLVRCICHILACLKTEN